MEKITYCLSFFLLAFQLGYTQNRHILNGKIISDGFSASGIDIVNVTKSIAVITDPEGKFKIEANPGDLLLTGGKGFHTLNIYLKIEDFKAKFFEIKVKQKVIELAEVEVQREGFSFKIPNKGENIRSVDNMLNSPRNNMVPNGSITDGVDFVKVGKLIGKLFKGKKDKNSPERIVFSEYAEANFDSQFYSNTLQLNKDEIALFLDFCEADPKTQIIVQNQNLLEVIDFLTTKKEEFRKLKN